MDNFARPRAYAVWGPRTRDRAQQMSGVHLPIREREGFERLHLNDSDARASRCGGHIRTLRRPESGRLSPAQSLHLVRQVEQRSRRPPHVVTVRILVWTQWFFGDSRSCGCHRHECSLCLPPMATALLLQNLSCMGISRFRRCRGIHYYRRGGRAVQRGLSPWSTPFREDESSHFRCQLGLRQSRLTKPISRKTGTKTVWRQDLSFAAGVGGLARSNQFNLQSWIVRIKLVLIE